MVKIIYRPKIVDADGMLILLIIYLILQDIK